MIGPHTSAPSSAEGSTPAPIVAEFPVAATIRSVEAFVDKALGEACDPDAELLLDFSDSTYIEIASLQHVTALIASRKKNDLRTKLRLPSGERGFRARSALRKWKYPAALKEATGLRFEDLVVEADLEYFHGNGGDQKETPYIGAQAKYVLPSGTVNFTIEAHRFFDFVTWNISKYRDSKRLVIDAYDAWNVTPVMAVLSRNLRRAQKMSPASGSADVYLASRVFYEAMSNAIRHPDATVIQTSSHLGTGKGPKEYFTIVFWDDGKSMLETLSDALAAGKQIRRPYPADFDANFALTRESEDGTKTPVEIVNSSKTPSCTADKELMLLSTLYPGTTCNFEGEGHSVRKELISADPRLGEPGMGLFVLLTTAIDMFGGSVAFRTDHYFMNVESATLESGATYSVKIKRHPETTPSFLGNMVTVRLPLGGN